MHEYPPQHRRFQDEKIPAHITYAYQKGATIVKNDDFYMLPDGTVRKVDILFVIASAPVSTAALPEGGSEAYAGLAIAMELAMNELTNLREFASFFGEQNQTSNGCGTDNVSASTPIHVTVHECVYTYMHV